MNEEFKMKHIGKRIFALSLLLFILLGGISAYAFPEPTKDFYVADYADVINASTENTIIQQNDLLYEQTGAQIVVVTVRYLEAGYYADEYAVKLFNDWGVGDPVKNNGILLLLVTEEGKGWLTQGSGISSALSNDDVELMLDKYFWKRFDRGDYDGAVETLFDELIEWYEDTYNFTLGDSSYVDTTTSPGKSYSSGKILFKAALIIIIILIFASSSDSRNSYRRGFWIPTTHTWHHRSPYSSNRYRHSDFGRSSHNSGNFGGGFRGGGGGHSGGGGAGRR